METLELELNDRILTVWLNLPPGNATTAKMFDELNEVFTAADRWPGEPRVVLLAARGKNFSVGADLSELEKFDPADAYYTSKTAREGCWALLDCKLPVVGAVRGAAVGGGMALAALCDVVVAARGARFGFPEIKVGVAGGAAFLYRFVPHALARWMFLTGELAPASALLQCGAIFDVVDETDLIPRALEICGQMARHSPVALRMAKHALNFCENQSVRAGYEFEQGCTAHMIMHPDSREAGEAFVQRRPGDFAPYKREWPRNR